MNDSVTDRSTWNVCIGRVSISEIPLRPFAGFSYLITAGLGWGTSPLNGNAMLWSAVFFTPLVSSLPAANCISDSEVSNGSNVVVFNFETAIVTPSEDEPSVEYTSMEITDEEGVPLPNPAFEFVCTGNYTGNDEFSAGVEGVFRLTFSATEIIHITVEGIKYDFRPEVGCYYSMVEDILHPEYNLDDVVWMVSHSDDPVVSKIHSDAMACDGFMTLVYRTWRACPEPFGHLTASGLLFAHVCPRELPVFNIMHVDLLPLKVDKTLRFIVVSKFFEWCPHGNVSGLIHDQRIENKNVWIRFVNRPSKKWKSDR